MYSHQEIEIMKSDVEIFTQNGADGIVFGCLDKNGNIDMENCKKVMNGQKLNWTFHRAFDVANDAFKAAKEIKELGFSRILTSGQVHLLFGTESQF